MIGYILGLLSVAWSRELSWIYPLLGGVLVALSLYWQRARGQVLGLLVAMVYALLWGQYQLSHRLPDAVAKVDLRLSGEISSIVERSDGNQRFVLELSERNSEFPKLRKVRLTLYQDMPALKQGDNLTVIARLQSPKSYLNEHSPDARRRALQRRIDAIGYVRELSQQHAQPQLRQLLYDRFAGDFEPKVAAFLSALVLGHSRDLSTDQWQLLSVTGTVHLVVVSGLHLGVLAVSGLALGRLLLFGLALGLPRYVSTLYFVPWLLAIALTNLYLWFGGTGLALQRAWVLVTVMLIGQLFRRTPSLTLRFKLALALVTLLDPLAVLELGFWLSFGLVWLLMQVSRLRGSHSWVTKALGVQVVLSLMLLPVLQYSVAQLNLLSMVSNIWAIPYISSGVMLLPLMLPLSFVPGFVSELTQWLISRWVDLFWYGLTVNAELGLSPAWVPAPFWALLLALVGAALLLTPLRLRWAGLLLLAPAILHQPAVTDEFSVTLLDVGQGQSAIIDLGAERWVYDTGPAFGSDFAVANLTLIPTLKYRPDLPLSTLIVSHSDRDHAGGVAALYRFAQPELILSGQPTKVAGEHCADGWAHQVGNTRVEVGALEAPTSDNDASCWIYIHNERCSLLIAGDLSVKAEAALMRRLKSRPLTWLQLSHHGSKTSTSAAWLDFWRPQVALNSSGRNNHFGHPHPEVVERLQNRSIKLLDTARVGAIELSASATECTTETFLQSKRRYWH